MIMEQYIHVTNETRKKLVEIFNCTSVMIWKALNFESDSVLAGKIRKAAYENGGILMAKSPVVETFFDHDNYLHQYFPNGATLVLNKTNSEGAVMFKGKTINTYKNVMLKDIPMIQDFAESLPGIGAKS